MCMWELMLCQEQRGVQHTLQLLRAWAHLDMPTLIADCNMLLLLVLLHTWWCVFDGCRRSLGSCCQRSLRVMQPHKC